LRLYGFFKQAKVGDCNVDKPAIYEFAAKAKWEAWNSLKGMTPIEAMKNYIATAVQIDPEISKRMSAIFHADEKEYG
jgi:diazepam-binding inhibitor (GABA receptor modulating acyl-CoA-binding protein)